MSEELVLLPSWGGRDMVQYWKIKKVGYLLKCLKAEYEMKNKTIYSFNIYLNGTAKFGS